MLKVKPRTYKEKCSPQAGGVYPKAQGLFNSQKAGKNTHNWSKAYNFT